MRLGEIQHLQWKDIDFRAHRISVTAKDGSTPKTCHERSTYVSAEVIDLLARYRARQAHDADSDWVLKDKLTSGLPLQLEPLRRRSARAEAARDLDAVAVRRRSVDLRLSASRS